MITDTDIKVNLYLYKKTIRLMENASYSQLIDML